MFCMILVAFCHQNHTKPNKIKAMKDLILQKLAELEKEKNIRILYACESGSRAWGFASPNSDWDVRFIYAHHRDWYLSIDDRKDMVDYGVDENEIDLTGWDLLKTLRLFRGSNASPFEWLQSPIIYSNPYNFREELFALAPEYFNHRHTAFHYLGLAYNSAKKGLVDGEMNIKKYFYVLRPLLAVLWILNKQTVPPMEFAPLLEQLKDNQPLYQAILALTAKKIKAMEGDTIQPIPIIQEFIEKTLEESGSIAKALPDLPKDSEKLNEFFRKNVL